MNYSAFRLTLIFSSNRIGALVPRFPNRLDLENGHRAPVECRQPLDYRGWN
jgi:hypothetical protein